MKTCSAHNFSPFNVSHTIVLKSSYPAKKYLPLFENATDVTPDITVSCE